MQTPIHTWRPILIFISLVLLLPAMALAANDQQYQQPVFEGDPGGGFYGADGDRFAGGGPTPAPGGGVIVLDVPLIGPFVPVTIAVPAAAPAGPLGDTARCGRRPAPSIAEGGAR